MYNNNAPIQAYVDSFSGNDKNGRNFLLAKYDQIIDFSKKKQTTSLEKVTLNRDPL